MFPHSPEFGVKLSLHHGTPLSSTQVITPSVWSSPRSSNSHFREGRLLAGAPGAPEPYIHPPQPCSPELMNQGSAAGSSQGAPIRCAMLKVQLHFLLGHAGDLQPGTANSVQLLVLSYGLTAGLSCWGLAAGGGG